MATPREFSPVLLDQPPPSTYAINTEVSKGLSYKALLLSLGFLGLVGGASYAGYSIYEAQAIHDSCIAEVKLDVVFVLDESWSVGEAAYSVLTDSVGTFVESLDFAEESFRVGVIEFSGIPNEFGHAVGVPYPSQNLKEVAIQSTINLDQYSEVTKPDLVAAIRNLSYSAPPSKGGVATEVEYRELNQRSHTCMSCVFQYLQNEFFKEAGNADPSRELFLIFITDGVPTRGNPKSPEVPMKEFRDSYPFRLLFIPIQGNAGIDHSIFGASFDQERDISYPVESYSQLATYVEELKAQEVIAKCG
mmetsp:Transcript_10361/g.11897  ORF Transcript_10361/g.11897 Transcript_10361/m.11897 type:complete len:304 (+) Transcript_10361:109-1020(+)